MSIEDEAQIFDSDNSTLPAFADIGTLPPGVHSCSFTNFASAAAFNVDRVKMWRQLASFLALPILTGKFNYAYVGGDFVSNHPAPGPIAVLLETSKSYGPDALAAVAEFFTTGIERFELLYGINLHFHIPGAPPELFDGPFAELKSGKEPAFYSNAGLARLHLTSVDSLVIVRTSIRGE